MLIEWEVTSSVLVAVVIALRYIVRGRILPRLEYALWALALVRLLVPVSFGSAGMSVMNAVPEPLTRSILSDVVYDGVYVPSGSSRHGDAAGKDGSHTGAAAGAKAQSPDWKAAAKYVWIAGSAAVGLFFAVSNLRFALRIERSRRALGAGDGKLRVFVSGAVDTPCLFGLFSPAIYLTTETACDATVLRHALAHETAHFRHGDHIWALLRCVCLALHWFNPLVWWAAILSRRDAELACDEAAISRLGESERAEYGRTLIGMTCQKRGG